MFEDEACKRRRHFGTQGNFVSEKMRIGRRRGREEGRKREVIGKAKKKEVRTRKESKESDGRKDKEMQSGEARKKWKERYLS